MFCRNQLKTGDIVMFQSVTHWLSLIVGIIIFSIHMERAILKDILLITMVAGHMGMALPPALEGILMDTLQIIIPGVSSKFVF